MLHCVALVALLVLKPSLQTEQLPDWGKSAYSPNGQAQHDWLRTYVPESHCSQLSRLTLLNFPDAHGLQSLCPCEDCYFPGAHASQADDSVPTAILPAPHGEHEVDPAREYSPTKHTSEHEVVRPIAEE